MIQHQFWVSNQIQPESSTYNIPSVFRITGLVNSAALEQGLNYIIKRHESFRMTFSTKHGRLERTIASNITIPLHTTDISTFSKSEQLTRQEALIHAEVSQVFDLSAGPLIRAQMIQLSQQEFILVIVMHHIITDLASKELFATELTTLYNAISVGNPLPVLETPIQYNHYVTWQNEWHHSQDSADMLQFWKQELKEQPPLLDLPLDYPRPPTVTSKGGAQWFQLDKERSRHLHKFSHQKSIAPFIVLLSCYLVLLSRYSRQNDITIGVPLSNRRREDDKKTMGCFVTILPLAFQLPNEMSFTELLASVRKKLLLAHRHQETSFDEIVAAFQPARAPSFNPIFQAGFTLEPPMELALNKLQTEPLQIHNQGSQLDLFLNFKEISPTVQGYFEYNSSLFSPDTIERLSKHYQNLLSSTIQHPDKPLSTLEFLAPTENNKLLHQWNNTTADYGEALCLHTLFEQQAAKTPDAIALIFAETEYSYQELNKKTNQLAHYLQEQGIGPDDLVAIFMTRSIEMVVAIYGIIKAGAAYVPLEPELPAQRIDFILSDTKAKVILTQDTLHNRLATNSATSLCLDTEWYKPDTFPQTNPTSNVTSNNLAYIIYTSGSTGTPKGVMIEHKAIYNRLQWMQDTFQLQSNDRILLKTPFSFDVSVWEFFWPLFTGATLVVAPVNAHKDPIKLCNIIKNHGITTIHFVPSMLRLFLDTGNAGSCTSLRQVICSGEALSCELQNSFFRHFTCGLHNLYGPTEAAVDVSYWKCTKQKNDRKVPIGFPIANTQLYILDEHLKPVAQGSIGELYIGGVQVARGYLHRPELNTRSFLPDPFSKNRDARLYKTGDLARYLPNGAIDYLGRVDFQVKLNGNRVELDEIAGAINQHSQIKETVVTLHTTNQSQQQLVAYLLSKETDKNKLQLRQHLANFLPDYMIPSQFILLPEFPLTENGKISRKQLPAPELHRETPTATKILTSGDLPAKITTIWQRILDRTAIGMHDNFFDVGGNSLLATQLSIDLKHELHLDVPLVKIFQYPTISRLSDYLKKDISSPTKQGTVKGRAILQRQALNKRRKK